MPTRYLLDAGPTVRFSPMIASTRGAGRLSVPRLPSLLVAVPAALLVCSAVAATEANDLCAPSADPCLVTTPIVATAGSVIDVGERELRIITNGSISVQGGNLTLLARRVVTGTGTLLRTSGRTRADAAGALEIVADEIVLTGDIDVRGSPAGEVDITASGALTMSGMLRGRSEAADQSASTTDLSRRHRPAQRLDRPRRRPRRCRGRPHRPRTGDHDLGKLERNRRRRWKRGHRRR